MSYICTCFFSLSATLCTLLSAQYLDFTSMTSGCGYFKYPNAAFDTANMPSTIQQAFNQIDFYLDTLSETYQIPSISFGIVYDQQLIHYHSIGFSNLSDASSTPTANTIYGIGSVSKAFTSLLSYSLAHKYADINIHDALYKFNSNFTIHNPWGITKDEQLGRTITIKHFLSQISGMFRQSPCTHTSCLNYTTSQILTELQDLYLIHPTAVQPSYSNLAFSLVGHILSEYIGSDYQHTLNEYLIKPLNLPFTGLNFADLANQSYIAAVPYSMQHKAYAKYQDLGWDDPAGGLFSTVQDLTVFMSQFFAAIPGTFDSALNVEYNFLISPQSLRDMLSPVFMNADMKTGFGTPWECNVLNGHLLRGKGGNVDGFAADIQMIPEMRLGVVALSNFEIDASVFTLGTMEILIPAFTSWLLAERLEYKAVYPSGFSAASYSGDYYFLNEVVFTIQHEVIHGNDWLFLLAPLSYGGRYGSLTWMNDSAQNASDHTFFFSNFQQNTESCWDITLLAIDGDTIEFKVVGNEVVGATSPDMNWDMFFVKQPAMNKRVMFDKRPYDTSKHTERMTHRSKSKWFDHKLKAIDIALKR